MQVVRRHARAARAGALLGFESGVRQLPVLDLELDAVDVRLVHEARRLLR